MKLEELGIHSKNMSQDHFLTGHKNNSNGLKTDVRPEAIKDSEENIHKYSQILTHICCQGFNSNKEGNKNKTNKGKKNNYIKLKSFCSENNYHENKQASNLTEKRK